MSLFTTARSAVGVVTRHNDINIVFLLVTVIALMKSRCPRRWWIRSSA